MRRALIGRRFPCQFTVGKTLAAKLLHCSLKPFAIVAPASVESKGLLIKVTEQMKRLYRRHKYL